MPKCALLLILLLAACGSPKPESDQATGLAGAATVNQAAPAPARAEPDDGKVECALAGSPAFERSCSIDRADRAEGRILTISGPSGGFRRLLVTRDGRGVIAADGSMPARVTILSPERIEVAIGPDRYRLPATIKS